jgi:hypothetical protein
MSELVSINLGSALPYLEDRLRSLFGKDLQTREMSELIRRQTKFALRDAGTMQIVGMDRPVAITDIYQPTRLLRQWRNTTLDVQELLSSDRNAVVFGRPGAGKTALLHFAFMSLTSSPAKVPILFTLRRPQSTDDLVKFTSLLANGKLKLGSKSSLTLLVDGFDEVTAEQRRVVTETLRLFQTLGVGTFIMTCRSYYPIDDTGSDHLEIEPFTTTDAKSFVVAFAKAYGVALDPDELVDDLSGRGFLDFLRHPLMLTLACILKSGPIPELPRTVIGLLRRAVDTLTFRWDESKGVSRDSALSVDGDDRVRCMMKVAFEMEKYEATDAFVQAVTRDYLQLLQRPSVVPSKLLEEIAQWYGMLIPVPGDVWLFAHRTVHDYLAAKHWVETGTFVSARVRAWSVRAAYAACLMPDATNAIVRMLQTSDDIAPFVECLYNNARFDVRAVASAICKHFVKFRGFTVAEAIVLMAETPKDFFRLASDDLLVALLQEVVSVPASDAHKVLFAFTLAEMSIRKQAVPEELKPAVRFRLDRVDRLHIRRGDTHLEFTKSELVREDGA